MAEVGDCQLPLLVFSGRAPRGEEEEEGGGKRPGGGERESSGTRKADDLLRCEMACSFAEEAIGRAGRSRSEQEKQRICVFQVMWCCN